MALQAAGVDFIIAETLPAVSEAKGIATAISSSSLPYIIGFVITPAGVLLGLHSMLLYV